MRRLYTFFLSSAVLIMIVVAAVLGLRFFYNQRLLKEMISRLEADSRVAEVIVTGREKDPDTAVVHTTIKFLEYDSQGHPLPPRYFTFSDDIIQFQSLVIRFDDFYVKQAHPLKGKSAYLFMKVFALKNSKDIEVYEINKAGKIPGGYKVKGSGFEQKLWSEFWNYALNREAAGREGIKNAQIEAPGTRFLPGYLYTLRIEHDGGLRVDAQRLPLILEDQIR